MLASFFKKSEPICFIAIFLITLLAFFISKTDGNIAAFTVGFIVKQIAYLFIIYATIFLLNFIVIKNSLTKKSNFEMLFFSFFFTYDYSINKSTKCNFIKFFCAIRV